MSRTKKIILPLIFMLLGGFLSFSFIYYLEFINAYFPIISLLKDIDTKSLKLGIDGSFYYKDSYILIYIITMVISCIINYFLIKKLSKNDELEEKYKTRLINLNTIIYLIILVLFITFCEYFSNMIDSSDHFYKRSSNFNFWEMMSYFDFKIIFFTLICLIPSNIILLKDFNKKHSEKRFIKIFKVIKNILLISILLTSCFLAIFEFFPINEFKYSYKDGVLYGFNSKIDEAMVYDEYYIPAKIGNIPIRKIERFNILARKIYIPSTVSYVDASLGYIKDVEKGNFDLNSMFSTNHRKWKYRYFNNIEEIEIYDAGNEDKNIFFDKENKLLYSYLDFSGKNKKIVDYSLNEDEKLKISKDTEIVILGAYSNINSFIEVDDENERFKAYDGILYAKIDDMFGEEKHFNSHYYYPKIRENTYNFGMTLSQEFIDKYEEKFGSSEENMDITIAYIPNGYEFEDVVKLQNPFNSKYIIVVYNDWNNYKKYLSYKENGEDYDKSYDKYDNFVIPDDISASVYMVSYFISTVYPEDLLFEPKEEN